jgi:signal transduction histidine kinase
VERLTLEGVFVIVRDDEGRILARTVGSAADAGEPFWRRAFRGGEPVGGQVTVSPDERGYVYAVPVEPPELESLSRSPYFYRALTAPPDRGSSDRERVEQAVAILLDNAVKYTAEWGKITVSTTRRDSGVMLEVSDMGKGIPEKDLPYVFERFYRANETRAARGSASR